MNKLEQIQQTLLELYNKNIIFLKQNHNELYNDIITFENSNQENYFIDFIDDHFELIDQNGHKTYNCDPFYDGEYRAKNIYKSFSGIANIDQDERLITSTDKFDFNLFINQYIDLFKNKQIESNTKFYKMIFIGTLLGVHLNDIDKIVKCKSYLIVEENIEIFRLSLFLTDYQDLSINSKLFFAISNNDLDLNTIVKEFLDYKSQYNYFIKYEIASENYISSLEQITNIIASSNPSIYPYSELMKNFINGLYNFQYSKNGILNLSKNNTILSKEKVLFLGAGPSLTKNIEFIKNYQNQFIIIAVASALKRLEKVDIIPDIIISMDSNKIVLNDIKVQRKYYKNSIVLSSINTNKNVVKKFYNNHLFLIQNSMELFSDVGIFTGVTVGDIGVKILLKLGVKELYLCGIDAALDQKDGKTHDETHTSSIKRTLEESNLVSNSNIDFSHKVIKVKGNFKQEVFTTVYYKNIIDSFSTITTNLDQHIYNLSDGAYLPNTLPIRNTDISLNSIKNINKQLLHDNIMVDLKSIAKNALSIIDKVSFKNELDYLNNNNIQINCLASQIIEYYHKLLDQYYFYLLENNLSDKITLNNIKNNQLYIIKSVLKESLND